MGSPRQDGICQELINQVRKYFLDCEIKLYDSYKLAPSPCTDCKWCEYNDGCSNKDLDLLFYDFCLNHIPYYNKYNIIALSYILKEYSLHLK